MNLESIVLVLLIVACVATGAFVVIRNIIGGGGGGPGDNEGKWTFPAGNACSFQALMSNDTAVSTVFSESKVETPQECGAKCAASSQCRVALYDTKKSCSLAKDSDPRGDRYDPLRTVIRPHKRFFSAQQRELPSSPPQTRVNTENQAQCQNLCEILKDCSAAIATPADTTIDCAMYQENISPQKQTSLDGAVAVLQDYTNSHHQLRGGEDSVLKGNPHSSYAILPGWGGKGFAEIQKDAKDMDACAAWCVTDASHKAQRGCTYATFNTSNNTCATYTGGVSLKSTNGLVRGSPQANVSSLIPIDRPAKGTMENVLLLPPQANMSIVNQKDEWLSHSKATSGTDCGDQCSMVNACSGVVYDQMEASCLLLKQEREQKAMTFEAGKVAYRKLPSSLYYFSKDSGPDAEKPWLWQPTENKEQCGALCTAEDDCIWGMFEGDTGQCNLYRTQNTSSSKSAKGRSVFSKTGTLLRGRGCCLGAVGNWGRYTCIDGEDGCKPYDTNPAAYAHPKVKGLSHCINLCQKDKGTCKLATYQNKMCYLYKKEAELGSAGWRGGAVTKGATTVQ